MFATIKNVWNNESGATAIEYGLIAALISVAAITAMSTMGENLTNTFTTVSSKLTSAGADSTSTTTTDTTTTTE